MASTQAPPSPPGTNRPGRPTAYSSSGGGFIGRVLAGGLKLAVGGVLFVVALVALFLLTPLSLPNPFSSTETQHDHAVVLAEMHDLSRFVAASGTFQALIDVEDDADYLPDFVMGERTIFAAEGDVEAYVEFGGLSGDALEISEDGDTVTVTLPPPVLGEPRIDPEATGVLARDRGIVDRIGDGLTTGDQNDDQDLYLRAERELAGAAAQSDLADRARRNTEEHLRSQFESLGFEHVVVVWDDPAAAG